MNPRYYILFILLFSIKFGNCSNDDSDKKTYLVFRFDDYSARSNTNLELKLIDAFRQNNLVFTVGVIPFEAAGSYRDTTLRGFTPLGQEKGDILKNAVAEGVIEVSLHGYSHQAFSHLFPNSEFRGLEFAKQKNKIIKGKKYLEELCETKIKTFVPPWNQYDNNTLIALEESQIYNISSDIHGTLLSSSMVRLLPNSCGLNNVKRAVETARKSSDETSIIVALFHLSDFLEDDKRTGILNLGNFSNLLSWVTNQSDVEVLTIDQMISKLPADYLQQKFRRNQKINTFRLKASPYVRGKTSYIYASKSYLNKLRLRVISFYIALLILSSSIAYFTVIKLKKFILKYYLIVVILNLIMIFSMLFYTYKHPEFGYNLSTIFTIFAGIIATSFVIILINKRKTTNDT